MMTQSIYTLDEIKAKYQEFIHKSDCPKIESLTNWGCHRFFLAQYFNIKDSCASSNRILIEFNSRMYQLDTTQAPKFLDQHNYIDWLQQQLLKA